MYRKLYGAMSWADIRCSRFGWDTARLVAAVINLLPLTNGAGSNRWFKESQRYWRWFRTLMNYTQQHPKTLSQPQSWALNVRKAA
jgi:hypothetical protein